MEKIPFKVGDQVKISFKSLAGQKTKQAQFEGKVIALRGDGDNKTFTVRKIATGKVAVERIFPLNSPAIDKIQVTKSQKVRRAKLYYLRKIHA